jgi:hypothetical protein
MECLFVEVTLTIVVLLDVPSRRSQQDMEGRVRNTNDRVLSVENERLQALVDMLSREQAKVEEERAELHTQLLGAKRKLRHAQEKSQQHHVAGGAFAAASGTHKRRTAHHGPGGGSGKVAPAGGHDGSNSKASAATASTIRSLKQSLQFETEENEALKASARAALERKDQEIALLRKAVKDTRKYCDEAVASLQKGQQRGVGGVGGGGIAGVSRVDYQPQEQTRSH